MKLFTDWRHLSGAPQHAAIALGNFDGVHRGHVYLLEQLRKACPDCPLGVLTFEPHPRVFFRPQDPNFRLMGAEERLNALSDLGVEFVVQIPFDEPFSQFSAETFVNEILIGALKVKQIACGADFAFGHRRQGDVAFLENTLKAHGAGLTVVSPLSDSNGPISSSRIRRLLQEGYPEQAAVLLGRHWSVRGIVEKGNQLGRLLGFPTANIALRSLLEPARGVYAVRVRHPDGRVIKGVANIGRRPTINDGNEESRLEVHLFDFDEDLYGKILEVSFIALLREEKRFNGLDALKAQIAKDATQAREILG
ncbi:bifunctional riboflavin kinase/FAD synthetase [Aristophania vespae]|uniref:bifunctional riboflavin kinase/FAD synthetase n=1 Tax=Aristophania vespae TaxID=2697033 RepID=UPI0023515C74|nr:bifunctional riboflavin kinase/FAD synthetase [Aristophania vespae]UMM64136.1 Bifunctional riboflavin kinase/FMN adenylyltransferase [Aristophania vespae]